MPPAINRSRANWFNCALDAGVNVALPGLNVMFHLATAHQLFGRAVLGRRLESRLRLGNHAFCEPDIFLATPSRYDESTTFDAGSIEGTNSGYCDFTRLPNTV